MRFFCLFVAVLLSHTPVSGAGPGGIEVHNEPLSPMADPAAVVMAGDARFTVLTEGLVRLEWSPDGQFEDRASQLVVNRRLPVPAFEQVDNDGLIQIKTPLIQLQYRSSAGVFSRKSLLLRARTGVGGDWVDIVPPIVQMANLGGTTRTLDGISGACKIDDGLLTRSGWTLLDDSRSLVLDAGPSGTAKMDAAGAACRVAEWPWAAERKNKEAVDWYFFVYGTEYPRALADFTKIAGRIPIPPRYVFGTWWSRYWAYSDKELRALVGEFREHDVPLDVLVVDMDWHLDGWTGYTWNPAYFPDPDGFLKWAHEQGLKVTLNLHPADGVGKHEAAFPEMCRALGLDAEKTERIPFDCANRRYIDAYFRLLHHPLEKQGVVFWWMDWQQGTDSRIAGLDPLWWLNFLHWKDMECRTEVTGRRPLIFSRWGGLGNHRYPIGFSGDTFCNWPSLAFQPYFTATAGNVGYAYWSHDIGGHQPGPVDAELYTRWIQWGALSPALRTHTTKNPLAERRIWRFPREFFEASRRAFHLRYELIPYIYSMARRCYDTALPLCRPLYYKWPDLDEAYEWRNEYLLGDDMLAAPVVEPADPITGSAMVNVWLPPGQWVHWFTGRRYEGPAVVPQVVPLNQIPLFVRAGAIIPTAPKGMKTSSVPAESLVLNVFPADKGEAVVYEDDGLSGGYLKGEFATTRVTQKWSDEKRLITIEPPKGSYKGMSRERGYIVRVFDCSPRVYEVSLDGRMLNMTSGPIAEPKAYWFFDPSCMGPAVQIPPRAAGETIRIQIDEPAELREDMPLIDGFRGLMATLCTMNDDTVGLMLGGHHDCGTMDFVFKLYEGSNLDIVKQWREAWLMAMDGVRKARHHPDDERKYLARLMHLFYKLDVRPDQKDPKILDIQALVGTTLPPGLIEGTTGNIKFVPDDGWRIEGYSEKDFDGLSEGDPVTLEAEIVGGGAMDTAVIRAAISIDYQGVPLSLPLEKTILPSINAWWVLGPFDVPFAEALDRKLPPEDGIDLKAEYEGKDGRKISWKRVAREMKPGDDLTAEFFMDFDGVFGGRVYESAAYAFTYLESPEDLDAVLAVGSDDGAAVWLNGKKVHHHQIGRPYASRQDRVKVRLKKGTNELLVKVSQGGGDWGLCVHVEDEVGRPLTRVKARLER